MFRKNKIVWFLWFLLQVRMNGHRRSKFPHIITDVLHAGTWKTQQICP